MAWRILGPLQVWVGDVAAVLGPRQRVVLAALLIHANQPVSAERLVDTVWERPTRSGPSNLRTHIAVLRRVLGAGRLRPASSGRGYQLTVHPGELDAAVFAECLAQGTTAMRSGDCAQAVRWLDRALRQWRGHPFEDMAVGPALRVEAARLGEQRSLAAEAYIDARLVLGDLGGLPEFIRHWLDDQPYREAMWAQLMLSLYRSGRAAEALSAYIQMRELLREGVGLEPSRPVRDLHERILLADPELDGRRRLVWSQ